MFLFHLLDEPGLDRFQSGLFYADGREVEPAAVAAAVRGFGRHSAPAPGSS